MSQDNRDIDPDDFFQDTRMSFGDHIEDLRKHLWRAFKGFAFALVFGFIIGKTVLDFITEPVKDELKAFYKRRAKNLEDKLGAGEKNLTIANARSEWSRVRFHKGQLRALFEGDFKKVKSYDDKPDEDEVTPPLWLAFEDPVNTMLALRDAGVAVSEEHTLSTLSVQEAVMVYVKVSIVTGFVLGSPWIFYQIWSFVAVGLYPNEKRLVNVYMPFSIGLFIIGVLLCQIFVIPKTIEALLWFNEWLGLKPEPRLNEWLGFAVMMPVVFGLSFQTPLVMLFVYKIGLMSVDTFRGKRRGIWFGLAVFAAVITPSVDISGMLLLWVPLCLLFELGIWLCMFYPKPPSYFGDDEVPESEEVIEV